MNIVMSIEEDHFPEVGWESTLREMDDDTYCDLDFAPSCNSIYENDVKYSVGNRTVNFSGDVWINIDVDVNDCGSRNTDVIIDCFTSHKLRKITN